MRRARQLAVLIAIATLSQGCGDSDEASSVARPQARAQPAQHHQRVAVPDVVGMRFGAAVRTLSHAGLEQKAPAFPGTLGNPAYGVECTAIDSESPAPGTMVERGSTVAIVYGACKHDIAATGHGSAGG